MRPRPNKNVPRGPQQLLASQHNAKRAVPRNIAHPLSHGDLFTVTDSRNTEYKDPRSMLPTWRMLQFWRVGPD